MDIVCHSVSQRKLCVPKASCNAFKCLLEERMIGENHAKSSMNLIGSRNISIHDDEPLNLDVLERIKHKHIAIS
ncbi:MULTISPECIES: HepT-like ribonuclease domain-containing protein [unclassified Sporosarcina]|uniref:HepT-like ribonuclease domain-containing protein n=1 Tax=unclassified Sporosarcina TaxID=2647733 RepID=UPI001179D8AE